MRYTPVFARDFEAWLSTSGWPYASGCGCPGCRIGRGQGSATWQEHFFPIEIHVHPSGYVQVTVVYGREGDHLRTASSVLTFGWIHEAALSATPISALQRIELGFVGILPAEEAP